MEQLLRNMTLEFFGSGKHKVSPEKLLETENVLLFCLLYTSPSPRDLSTSRMPSSA